MTSAWNDQRAKIGKIAQVQNDQERIAVRQLGDEEDGDEDGNVDDDHDDDDGDDDGHIWQTHPRLRARDPSRRNQNARAVMNLKRWLVEMVNCNDIYCMEEDKTTF